MKIKVKRSFTEGVFTVEKEEVIKYIKSSGLKSIHIINPSSSLFTNYDCTTENTLKKVRDADLLAIVIGRAAANNLDHNLSVVKNDELLIFKIGDVEKDLDIIELSEEEIKKHFDPLLKTNSIKKLGLCENDGCFGKRRNGSKYCQVCSDKFKKNE